MVIHLILKQSFTYHYSATAYFVKARDLKNIDIIRILFEAIEFWLMKTRCLNFVHDHNTLDVYELTIQEKTGLHCSSSNYRLWSY